MNLQFARRSSSLVSAATLAVLLPGIALAKPQAPMQHAQGLMKPSQSTTVATKSQSNSNFIEDLKLTGQQKAKIQSIRSARTQQIHKVLDAKQWTKFQQNLKAGQKLKDALKDLNLSKSQAQQISTIVAKSAVDIRGTLTAQQRQKLDAYLKQQRTTAQNSVE